MVRETNCFEKLKSKAPFGYFIQNLLINPGGNDRPNLDGFDVITENFKVPMNIFFSLLHLNP